MTALWHKMKESLYSLAPVVILGLLMGWLTGFMTQELLFRWLVGSLFVFIGIFLFLRGVEYCLSPLGELFGDRLPFAPGLMILLPIAFVVTVAASAADPGVAILGVHMKSLATASAPPPWLVVAAAVVGTGFFLCLGLLRIIFNWSSRVLFGACYGALLVLGYLAAERFIGLGFDAGGIASGPLVVPFVLSLGVGFVGVLGREDAGADSFGLLGLICLGPMFCILLLGIFWS